MSFLSDEDIIDLHKEIYASISRRIEAKEREIELDSSNRYITKKREKERKIREAGTKVEIDEFIKAIESKLNEIRKLSKMGACMKSIEFVQFMKGDLTSSDNGVFLNSFSLEERIVIAKLFCRKLSVVY